MAIGRWLSYGLLLWSMTAVLWAQQTIPPLNSPVTDLTGTLSAPQRSALEQQLTQLEAEKGSQIAVLLVPTTAPEAIEQYSLRVAEAWQLGREGVDDGALLLIAKDDRKLRIEVGYGLEGVIPDATAKRIISEVISPKFRQGDFAGGIGAGVERLIGLVNGEPLPEPSWQDEGPGGNGFGGFGMLLPVLFLIFPFLPMLSRAIGRLPGAVVSGGLLGGLAYLASGSLILGLALGGFAFFIALQAISGLQRNPNGPRSPGKRLPRRRQGRDDYYDDGFGGIFTGGGGGGFGGGGGGFGGGGASGSW